MLRKKLKRNERELGNVFSMHVMIYEKENLALVVIEPESHDSDFRLVLDNRLSLKTYWLKRFLCFRQNGKGRLCRKIYNLN